MRQYKNDVVSKDDLATLIDAARMAPSAANMQRIRFVVATSAPLVEKILRHTAWGGFVKPRRTPTWGEDAPAAFILLTSTESPEKETIHADAGAAIQNIALAAVELGLGTCWIASFDKTAVAEALDLPSSSHPLYLVAVGYPGESPVSETVEDEDSLKYYLDDNDTLHVPKLSVDALTTWK